jgi:hypothetical protein
VADLETEMQRRWLEWAASAKNGEPISLSQLKKALLGINEDPQLSPTPSNRAVSIWMKARVRLESQFKKAQKRGDLDMIRTVIQQQREFLDEWEKRVGSMG